MDTPDPASPFFEKVLTDELQQIRKRRALLPGAPLRSLIALRAYALHQMGSAASAEDNWRASCARFDEQRNAMKDGPAGQDLVGLALSGGGIRSATFCLGFLQALEKFRLLPMFDYLSTVSGGGFVGGFWSAWMTRKRELCLDFHSLMLPDTLDLAAIPCLSFDPANRCLKCRGQMTKAARETFLAAFRREVAESEKLGNTAARRVTARASLDEATVFCDRVQSEIPPRDADRLFPPPERIEPERASGDFGAGAENAGVAESGLSAGDDPLHHLRLFSNYLTPRKGFLSTDAWRAATVIMRNLVMNWIIVLPLLFTAIAMPRIYFAFEPEWTSASLLLSSAGKLGAPASPAPAAPYVMKNNHAVPAAYALTRDIEYIQAILTTAPGEKPGAEKLASAEPWEDDYLAVLQGRALYAAIPLAIILSWLVVLSIAWMTCVSDKRNTRDWLMGLGTFTAGVALVVCFAWFANVRFGDAVRYLMNPGRNGRNVLTVFGHPATWMGLAVLPSLLMVGWAVWPLYDRTALGHTRNEVRQNRIVRIQTGLVILMAFLLLVLLASGFAYELFMYAWTVYGGPYVHAAGWLTVLGTIGAAAYTAWKAAPTGGADRRQVGLQPPAASQVVFAVTPFLVWGTLLVIGEALLHAFLRYVDSNVYVTRLNGNQPLPPLFKLTAAAGVGLLLCVLLSASEMRWKQEGDGKMALRLVTVLLVVCAVLLICAGCFGREHATWSQHPWIAACVTLAAGLLIPLRLLLNHAEPATPACSQFRKSMAYLARTRSNWFALTVFAAGITATLASFLLCLNHGLPGVRLPHEQSKYPGFNSVLSITPALGSLLCLIVLFFEVKWGFGKNGRTVGLLAAIWVMLALMLGIGSYHYYLPGTDVFPQNLPVLRVYAWIDLIAVALSCVVAMGWTADPNALSLHESYKFRLVRAYLGASNPRRTVHNSEITDSVEGDDVKLSGLVNCSRGGPYQLVNVTLNLTAGRDIATSQRSSAHFLLSQMFCGSLRTGFRPTSQYMGGRLTLGTAIAISGAAASPNMGDKTPGAASAALLALLNIRLGYWAPTPHRGRWMAPRARLWPFYIMREFLSQTNDLSSYCYLTDGGHFDNTGLYALVQRGCRYILALDCGADPRPPAFEDLGDALRRCRIDFGAEIHLDLDPLIPVGTEARGDTDGATVSVDADKGAGFGAGKQPKGPLSRPFALGTIIYSTEHARRLNWKDPDRLESRKGVILWVKPSMMATASGDVRQYSFAHSDFPQQGTANQWFDEAQFESYRRLGEHTGHALFNKIRVLQDVSSDGRDAVFTPAEADWFFDELRRNIGG